MPPPWFAGKAPEAWPLVMVRLDIVTIWPELMWNTRLAALPSTASRSGPGPMMPTLLVTRSSPLVSKMVPVTEKCDRITVGGTRKRVAQRAGAAVVGGRDHNGGGVDGRRQGRLCHQQKCNGD